MSFHACVDAVVRVFMFPRRLPLAPRGGSTVSSTHCLSVEESNRISVLSWIVSDDFPASDPLEMPMTESNVLTTH